MASKLTLPCLFTFTVLVAMVWTGALAQSGCTNELMGLSPCLNYVTGNSSTPSSSCCTQLAGVVKSQPQCLCLLVNGGASSVGITINQTRAIALPDACNLQTPPASRCNSPNGQNPSSGTPATSPANSSNGTPKTPTTPPISDTPAGRGSDTVPSTVDSSAGGNMKASFQLVGFLLFIALYALSAPAS